MDRWQTEYEDSKQLADETLALIQARNFCRVLFPQRHTRQTAFSISHCMISFGEMTLHSMFSGKEYQVSSRGSGSFPSDCYCQKEAGHFGLTCRQHAGQPRKSSQRWHVSSACLHAVHQKL